MPAVTANAQNLKKQPTAAPGKGAGPATVQTKDLVVGTGAVAKPHDAVTVHYVGSLYSNGKVFDSSWTGAPVPFSLDGVVPGFAKGIEGMKIGGRRIIVIPSDLAYGPDGSPPVIPPNAVLIFIVDLKAIG
jgi:peptidylprolyl isomerase